MRETERTRAVDEFRQGDIIRIEEGNAGDSPSNLGVIINADCDLVHGKHDGVIAYLPVYPFQKYVERFWAPKYVEGVRHSASEKIKTICKLSPPHFEDLLRWLRGGSWFEIYSKLSAADELKRKQDKDLKDALEVLARCSNLDHDSFDTFVWHCRREREPEKYIHRQINRAYKEMGDGHLFISEIAGNEGIGFVIRMRRIYTIDVECCFFSEPTRLVSTGGDSITAVRFARLAAPFRFRFAQLFAYQFSKIGLPDETIELNELAVDDMSQSVLEQLK